MVEKKEGLIIILFKHFNLGVFAKDVLSKGTRFGPFKGDIIRPCDLDPINSQNCWEIFDNDGCVEKYIVAKNCYDNWMTFVNCARYGKEQNVVVLQEGTEIYYEVSENIDVDQELLAWYGNSFQKYMEIPITKTANMLPIIETAEKKFASDIAGEYKSLFLHSVNRDLEI